MKVVKALIVFAVLACAFAFAAHHYQFSVRTILLWVNLGPFVFGAVTITNLYPFTSAPTVNQGGVGRSYNSVIATIATTATGDNSAVITHQFGLAAAEISQGFPMLTFIAEADDTTGAWFEASENPNYTVLGSNSAIAVRALTRVIISTPHTYFR